MLCMKYFYVHETAAVDLSKIYFLKNAMKTCKPNNRDLNRDWKSYKTNSELTGLFLKNNAIIPIPTWLPVSLACKALKRVKAYSYCFKLNATKWIQGLSL